MKELIFIYRPFVWIVFSLYYCYTVNSFAIFAFVLTVAATCFNYSEAQLLFISVLLDNS